MEKTNTYYGNGETTPMDGCGVDDSDEIFYAHRKATKGAQEDQATLDDLFGSDSGVL